MNVFAQLFDALLLVHVAAGFVGLAAFWFPVFARKGGRVHVVVGRAYAWCAYVVTLSAIIAAPSRIVSYRYMGISVAEQPERYAFAVLLGYLGVVTFVMVRQGLRVLATRRAPEKLRTPAHEALAWASMAGSIFVVGFGLAVWSDVSPILLGMSPIGLFTGRRMLRLMRDPRGERMGWFYSHLASMLGGGIAFHTAFIVFGAQRLWAYEIEGALAIVPWILPTVFGVPAIVLWTRRYRRKFNRGATRTRRGQSES
ncbi:MAG: hypothetical protein J4G03_01330 [Gemmatimonadetes bacterium]|nr:hypothetical protein [Gemmatimonadota bacterium]